MATATAICSSIEGRKIFAKCRKFTLRIPRRHAGLGRTVYPFKLGISGQAAVDEELNPKQPIESPASSVNKNDRIVGTTLDGFSTRPPRQELKPDSGRHRATFLVASDYAYLHIEIGLRELLQQRR